MDQRLVKVMRNDVAGAKSLLDVGCMFGDYMAAFSDIVRRREGIEIFEDYERLQMDKEEGAEYRYGDAREILPTLSEGYADLVLMIDVIEHMTMADGEDLIKEAKRIAKKIILFTPEGDLPQHPNESTIAINRGYGTDFESNPYQGHKSGWSIGDLENQDFHVRALWTLGERRIGEYVRPSYRVLYATWGEYE